MLIVAERTSGELILGTHDDNNMGLLGFINVLMHCIFDILGYTMIIELTVVPENIKITFVPLLIFV
jgi:hypothetical protein